MYSQEEYERLINSSVVFFLDKEKDYALWIIESRKLTNLICEYYYNIVWQSNSNMKDNYSLELIDSAKSAILAFKHTEGVEFLHYFRKILSNSIRRAKTKEYVDNYRQGIHVARETDRLIKLIIKFAKANNMDLLEGETVGKISSITGISEEEINHAIQCYRDTQVISSIMVNDEGEEINLLDLFVTNECGLEKSIEDEEVLINMINKMDQLLEMYKGDTYNLLSILVTTKIIGSKLLDKYLGIIEKARFFNNDLYNKYVDKGIIFTQKQIAEKFGRKESSISRTYKDFINKYKNIIKED